jgi:Co/Zn/Cd efflux system component
MHEKLPSSRRPLAAALAIALVFLPVEFIVALVTNSLALLADAAVSTLICLLIVAGAARLLRESWHILMEGVPRGFSSKQARAILCRIEDVASVHDIHAWAITTDRYTATAHIVIRDGGSSQNTRLEASRLFEETWGIGHVTFQIIEDSEAGRCSDETCCTLSEAPGGGETHDSNEPA